MEQKNKTTLRPCAVVKTGDCLFHMWEQYSKPIAAGLTTGSHPAGVVSYIVGIVEDREGWIHRVPPEEIRFTDYKVEDYFYDPTTDSQKYGF